jgi:hypothetical protein
VLVGGRIKNAAFKSYGPGYRPLRPMSLTKQSSFVSVPPYTLVILRRRLTVTMRARGVPTLHATGAAGRLLSCSLPKDWLHKQLPDLGRGAGGP